MKRTVKNTVLILLLFTLSASTAFLAYLHFFAPGETNLSGEWTTELDMTGKAAVTALGWLQDIEAVAISLDDMEKYMQGLTIQVDMSLEQTARTEGTFRCNVVQESYDACDQAAYEAFAMAFRALLAERLRMAGYAGSMDEDAIETLVAETFGMPTVQYLRICVPDLLPSIEALQAEFDGSGTYGAAEGILTRQFDDGGLVKVQRYIRKGDSLLLFEDASLGTDAAVGRSPVLYMMRQP